MLIINDQLQQRKQLSTGILHWLQKELRELSPLFSQNKTDIYQTDWLIQRLFDENNLLVKFLLRVNYEYFSKTQIMDYSGLERRKRVFTILEKYINYTEKKRYSKNYRKELISNTMTDMDRQYEDINYDQEQKRQSKSTINKSSVNKINVSNTLIPLLLFICTRSQNNQQFISRIITLPLQQQHQLKQEIQWVGESLLQEITQKEELVMKFNQLKQNNQILGKQFNQITDYNWKLKHRLQRGKKGRALIEQRLKQNYQQKLTVCQQLNHPNLSTPYTTIFRNHNERNSLLHLLLQQKQKKHEQLITKNKQIVEQLDSFQQVLEELVKQKKQVKKILNDKENQSFMLQMRLSLKASQGNQWAMRSKRSNCKNRTVLKSMNINDMNNQLLTSQKRRSSLHVSINPANNQQELHQSINIISKIQELKGQKQALIKQLSDLKSQNTKLKKKQNRQQKLFMELSGLYTQCLKQFGVNKGDQNIYKNQLLYGANSNKLLKKQRSKTVLTKVNSKRYIE